MNRPSPVEALAALRTAPWYRGQIVSHHELPPRIARTVPVPTALHETVRSWLSSRGVDRLYTHQAAVFEAASRGKDVAVATATASGKTLAFLLPVLDRLAADEDATALFLYPLKALANDQLQVLREAEAATGLCLEPALYDGDTPRARRPAVRQFSRVVLSNPYEIHETLPQHHLWRRFFAALRFVVVDEAHRYTGVFGSNVAQVLRRLLRVAQAYGPPPAFIAASASIANPGEHVSALTGRDCVVVDDDGSPAGARTLAFFDAGQEETGSALVQTRDVFCGLVGIGLKTLCFTQSRKAAELVASLAFERKGPRLPIAPYRAGYLPDERRRLEADFREGRLRGVVSTSALELGIDIGDLDAVVISGYPGSVSGFWQQAGRAGRRSEPSLTVFVARQDIIDQYLLRHPGPLLSRTYERATVDLENCHILAGHLLCAASELPLTKPPEPAGEVAAELAGKGMLHKTDAGYLYAGLTRPHQAVRLDRIGDVTITLVDAETDRPLETLDFGRALREAFTGAVYLHGGETWICEELDLGGLVARLRRRDVGFYTQALTTKVAEILVTRDRRSAGSATVSTGRIRMTHTVTGFLRKRFGRTIGKGSLDLPPLRFETDALWIDVSDIRAPGMTDPLGSLHALEHALVGLAPLVLSCDPSDLAGFSTLAAPHSGGPALFLFDGHDGGIGLSRKAYDDFERLLGMARDLLRSCPCADGCPACCLSPRCGNDNQPMDRQGAVVMAGRLKQG